MPHATNNDTMAESKLTNGVTSNGSSKVLNRVTSYPVVNDSIETFKSNPYGKKSIDLAEGAYQRFGKPVEPYLETPYSYVKPYAAKADELADSGLGHVETHFPIVKEDTTTIVDKGKSVVYYPFKVADDGRNYLVNTWQDEYKKTSNSRNNSNGLFTLITAVISFDLRVASDFFQAISDILGPKYAEGKQTAQEYAAQAQEKAEEYKKYGLDKAEELKKNASGYAKDAQQKGEQAAKDAQQTGEQYAKEAEKKGEQVKAEASSKKEEAKKQAGAK